MEKLQKLEKATLEGEGVRLEPLQEKHLPGLADAIQDGDLWNIPVTFVPQPKDLNAFLDFADDAFLQGRELVFATIDKATEKIAGSTRFRCIELAHRRAEIGFTFLGQSWQRTHVNTEAKFLMLQHAFEHWGLNRVELLTDLLNINSRNAIARIGAKEEGVLRNHMVMRDGRIRDSVMFSLIRSEWPSAKAFLVERMKQKNVSAVAL